MRASVGIGQCIVERECLAFKRYSELKNLDHGAILGVTRRNGLTRYDCNMSSSCMINIREVPSELPARIHDLINMLPAILVRRLQVVQLLIKI